MLRTDTLPPEFQELSGIVNYVVKRTNNEYSGSCPQCGGNVHKSGEPPDRFRMWVVSNYGKPLAWCRHCSFTWTPNKGKKPSKEEIETWRNEQIRVEQERKEAAERALELLNNERIWEKFYLNNNQYSKQLFSERGIAESWVNYLQLGLIADYTVKTRNNGDWEHYHSPAISIPVWNVGGVVQNVKLRVTNPRTSADRYRNWYEQGQSYLYVPLYDLPLSGTGVLVEGEFKAIAMEQALDNPKLRVVGVQSKSPSQDVLEQLKNLDLIYVWLDPDAFEKKKGESPVERMCRMLGKERVRVIQSTSKCDDIINYGINPMDYINNARKA